MPVNPFILKKYGNQAAVANNGGNYYSGALNYLRTAVGSAIAVTYGSATNSGGPERPRGPGGATISAPNKNSKVAQMVRRYQGSTRTMTKTKRKRGGSSRMSLTRRILNTVPAKHFKYNNATALSKGAPIYTWSPTQSVLRGTADDQRVGDTITLCSLKWNGVFNSDVTSNSYIYRLIIGFTGEEFNAATFLTNYTTGELFQSSTVGAIKSNGIVNPKAFTLLFDQKFTISSNLAGVVDVMPVVGSINLKNQKFVYQADGSTYGKMKNLVVIIMGDEIVGSAAPNAGGASISWDFCFK